MKRLLLVCYFMLGIKVHAVRAMGFLADTVKVGFQKDTISILEGKSEEIIIELNGVLPSDSTVEVKWVFKDSDATLDKDFKIIGVDKFTFMSEESAIQGRLFKIEALKDANVENEKFVIELSFMNKGKTFSKLTTKKCLIILKDFKTEFETFKEDYAELEKNILKKISDVVNKDTSEVIGTLKLKKQPIVLYNFSQSDCRNNKGYIANSALTDKDKTKKLVEISKVDVVFKYGLATEIRAFKDSTEIFSNQWLGKSKEKNRSRYGVSYRHNSISERNKHYYLIGEKDICQYIKLADLLDYDLKTGLNFAPSDTSFTISSNKKEREAKLTVKTSLNSYINFNIYTDLLGLLKIDQKNGIIQSDVSAKIFLTSLPSKQRLHFKFHYLMPYARLARFENGFENVPTVEGKSFVSKQENKIDQMVINQRKSFDIGLKMNILDWVGKINNTYELNTYAGFGWFNRQGDSLKTLPNKEIMYESLLTNTLEYGIEARASILQYHNFGINTGFMATYQKIINAQQNSIADGGFKPFYRTEAEIFYYPIAKSKDKIFLRTYYTFNGSKTEESFLRIQVGYKALFKISNKK